MGRVRWGAAVLLLAVLVPGVSAAHRGGKPHAGTFHHGSHECARCFGRVLRAGAGPPSSREITTAA